MTNIKPGNYTHS